MNLKKKIIIITILGFITTEAIEIGNAFYNYFYPKNNIKVMAYKPPSEAKGAEKLSSYKTSQNEYQIDKYEDIESVAWINENQVLTLTKKDTDSTLNSSNLDDSPSYCSIYNLNTKESKDYKEVNIGKFLGISPNKQYVLYSEAGSIPKVGSEEWKKIRDSGELFHREVKFLNLTTGEISYVKTEKFNCNTEYEFISDNKVLTNDLKKWAIIDKSGEVLKDGTYNIGDSNYARIAGFDELKDLGSRVEGKFYYTQQVKGEDGVIGAKICSVNVNTNEIEGIYENKYSHEAVENGRTILLDKYNNNGEAVDGVYKNRTFGYYILDKNGNIIYDIDAKQGRNPKTFALSVDGSKGAYVEEPSSIKENNTDEEVFVKIIDIKTGNIDEVAKLSNFEDRADESEYRKMQTKDKEGNIDEKSVRNHSFVTNICWDKAGTSLIFNYKYFSNKDQKYKLNTYIITCDK